MSAAAAANPPPLEIRVDHPLGQWLVLQVLPRLEASLPGLSYRLEHSEYPAEWTGKGPAMALCLQQGSRLSALSTYVGRLPLHLFATPHYLASARWSGSPAGLGTHPVMDLDFGQRDALWWLQSDQQFCQVATPPRLHETRDPSDALAFALAHRGLAWLPADMVEDDVRRARLVPALPGWRRQTPKLHACFPSFSGPHEGAIQVVTALTERLIRSLHDQSAAA